MPVGRVRERMNVQRVCVCATTPRVCVCATTPRVCVCATTLCAACAQRMCACVRACMYGVDAGGQGPWGACLALVQRSRVVGREREDRTLAGGHRLRCTAEGCRGGFLVHLPLQRRRVRLHVARVVDSLHLQGVVPILLPRQIVACRARVPLTAVEPVRMVSEVPRRGGPNVNRTNQAPCAQPACPRIQYAYVHYTRACTFAHARTHLKRTHMPSRKHTHMR